MAITPPTRNTPLKIHLLGLPFLAVFFTLQSCSPFSNQARHHTLKKEDALMVYSHDQINLRSATFMDFKFAVNRKQFKAIAPQKKPAFQNILLYATTQHPPYDYYLLLDSPPITHPDYIKKDTLIDNRKITFAISRGASEADVQQLWQKLGTLRK